MRIPLDKSFQTLLVVRIRVYDRLGAEAWRLRAAVDTGASSVMIPREAAQSLGYVLDGVPTEQVVTGDGMLQAPKIIIGSIDVGGVRAMDVPALCHDLPEQSFVDALLGLSFLTRFHLRFDFDAWEMELLPRS